MHIHMLNIITETAAYWLSADEDPPHQLLSAHAAAAAGATLQP
jgi:hypothetical protein